mmetsp:Transcript_22916/g.59818  ORF Transcript_22916/g.59818 Transcript_22916/m.59818 type:complete len:217 (-) Transcript_22916:662-1312(-)
MEIHWGFGGAVDGYGDDAAAGSVTAVAAVGTLTPSAGASAGLSVGISVTVAPPACCGGGAANWAMRFDATSAKPPPSPPSPSKPCIMAAKFGAPALAVPAPSAAGARTDCASSEKPSIIAPNCGLLITASAVDVRLSMTAAAPGADPVLAEVPALAAAAAAAAAPPSPLAAESSPDTCSAPSIDSAIPISAGFPCSNPDRPEGSAEAGGRLAIFSL